MFGRNVISCWIGGIDLRLLKKGVEVVVEADDTIEDIEKLMDEKQLVDEDFHYFFQLDENDDRVIFVELLGYDVDDYAIETGRRSYMLETAVLDKNTNKLHVLGDTNAEEDHSFLNGRPVWSENQLKKLGIKILVDSTNFSIEHWSEFVN